MSTKTAILFGSTGLTGSNVLRHLVDSPIYSRIILFNRQLQKISHPKITEQLFAIDNLDGVAGLIVGDDLFCCLGTTIKKAGTQEVFRKVDLDAPVKLAEFASRNKLKNFIVISSIGANALSKNFYLQTKGLMEQSILASGIEKIVIVRPSMLLGHRNKFRFGELIGKAMMSVLGLLFVGNLKKYKGIQAETVAKAMINLANNPQDKAVFESDELQKIGKNQ
jgi:uncharacterized protein YbjT (DUF2867 family)